MSLKTAILLLALIGLPLLVHSENTPFINETPIHEAYATRFQRVNPPEIVNKKPPADKIHNIPPKPFTETIWVPGYWAWVPEIGEYKWVCGVWRNPPPDHQWVAGSWIKNKEGWSWLQGFWSPVPEEKLVFIRETPPLRINDNPPPAPSKNSFWVLGYWEYSQKKKTFGWIEGTWQEYDPNWVLTPATYMWRPNGYIFVAPYWDYPIDKRGTLYSCTYPMNKISTDTVLQSCFANYPDHINWYHHWWHFHKKWWANCNCTPPWWNWMDWWTFGWQDQWALWWWYTHPGFPQPSWLSAEISAKITPPDESIVTLMKQIRGPEFLSKIPPVAEALKPTGTETVNELKRPMLEVEGQSVGKIAVPKALPAPKITPPKPVDQPLPIEIPATRSNEGIDLGDPTLTPLLDSDRPDYSQYEPMYEYRYQPQHRYQPEYYYKPYRDESYTPSDKGGR